VARTSILDLVTAGRDLQAVILDIGASADLDLTTVDMLRDLLNELRERKVDLIFAYARGPVRERMRITGLCDQVGDCHIFLSTEAAVQEYQRRFPGKDIT
jgi:sulfate permease, SulP family